MSGNFDESGKNGPENLPAIVKSAILAKKIASWGSFANSFEYSTNFD